MNTRHLISRTQYLPLIAALLAVFPAIAGTEMAGRFQFVAGDVRVIDAAGRERAPMKGDKINEGDTVVTAPSASAQILMADKGLLAVRPDTRLKIDTFKYAGKEDGSERGLFSLLRGGFRAITGAVGNLNKQNYVIRTPGATIGIRGTDHEPMYIAPPLPGEKPLGPPGTYDKVNVGAAFIRTGQGTANVGPNQVGYAAGGNTAPTVLTTLPAFYKATPAPEPRTPEEQKEAKGADTSTTTDTAETADTSTSKDATATETTTAAGETAATSESTTETATTTTSSATEGTTSATGTEPIRTATASDTALLGAVTTTTATTSTVSPTAATETSSTGTAPATTTLTATDSSGSILNLDTQTTTTSSGATIPGLTTTMQAPATIVLTAYSFSDANCTICPNTRNFFGQATFDSAGRLLSINPGLIDSKQQSETVNVVATSTGTATQATSYATTGVSFGRWAGITLSGTDFFNNNTAQTFTRTPIGSYHWLAGPDVAPNYLPMVLTGTSSYTIDGYTAPTDHNNVTGTLDTAYTSLSYNFGTQSANASIKATVASRTWTADAINIMIHGEGSFNAYTGNTLNEQKLNLTMTDGTNNYSSASNNAWGSLNGSLFGTNLAGAGLTFAFNANDSSAVNGAIAFAGTAQSTVPYQGVFIALGDTGFGAYREEFGTFVDGGFSATSRVTGTTLDGRYPVSFTQSCTVGGGTCTSAQDIPVTFTNNTTPMEPGTDATTGISWGRWANVTMANRVSGGTSPGTLASSVPFLHFITSSSQDTPVALPITGTASYVFAGGTSPTDQAGNVGALTSTSLNANFTNKTVDVNLALTMPTGAGTQQWNAGASGIPIHNGAYFEARNMPSGQNTTPALSVSCTGGNCVGASYGQVIGAFTGTSGQGAALAYSLNNPTAATTVSGVAAFKK